jgi:hypothetical protein
VRPNGKVPEEGDTLMGDTPIETVEDALKKFRPDHEFWQGAYVHAEVEKFFIEVQWRNPELAGTWALCYPLSLSCFRRLLLWGYIEAYTMTSRESIFQLSKKGALHLVY